MLSSEMKLASESRLLLSRTHHKTSLRQRYIWGDPRLTLVQRPPSVSHHTGSWRSWLCGKSSGPNKTLFPPCISGQSPSLLYQDVCPTTRPIALDLVFQLQSRRDTSSGRTASPTSGWQVSEGEHLGEGHLTATTPGSMCMKGRG